LRGAVARRRGAAFAAALGLAGCSAKGGAGARMPSPRGCVTDVAPGAHTFTCEGLRTDLFAPSACPPAGCGLILELHGDTGSGLLFDANTDLMSLGAAQGYLVVAPTGPERSDGLGPTWTLAEDDKLIAILDTVAGAFQTDPRRRHVTGFSRGGYVTWRLLCEHADLFASVAPAAGGSGPGGGCDGVPEVSCPFDAGAPGGMPSRPRPVLDLIGRTDVPVPYACAARIRDQAIAAWGLRGPLALDGDAAYTHARWSPSVAGDAGDAGEAGDVHGAGLVETFEHSYETAATGPEAALKGHCVPGSNFDPFAPRYAVACAPPNAFRWGAEVMRFFVQHPEP
jgi:poly(3-hydroxybutyrate) depolymerase